MARRFGWLALVALAPLGGCVAPDRHAPPFARELYAPFSRAAAVAIALDEWRLWGSRVDNDPFAFDPPAPDAIPERQEGFWQRIGEYWWEGQNAGGFANRYTGLYDEDGRVIPPAKKGNYAWSAAFVSYVMRMAGAGRAFPYAPTHATYIDAAVRGETSLLTAEDPARYAPRPGDIVCFARSWAVNLRFKDLPTKGFFPAHCGIVTGGGFYEIDMVGGNVDNAVTMTKISGRPGGLLSTVIFQWLVVLRVNYAA